MKKKAIILTAILFMFVSSSAFALNNFYIDGYGSFITTGDAKTQIGGGLQVGYNLLPGLNIAYRFQYTFLKELMDFNDAAGHTVEGAYNVLVNLIGPEYVWNFGRIGWRSSLLLGVVNTQLPYRYDRFNNNIYTVGNELTLDDDTIKTSKYAGVAFLVSTGVQYEITQHVAPFIEAGFHYDYFNMEKKGDYKTASSPIKMYGVNVLVGVRFTIGSNKSIGADY